MIHPAPVVLDAHGVRLEPLGLQHQDGLVAAVQDGRLWELWFTAVPEPTAVESYIAAALDGQREGRMLPWAVLDAQKGLLGYANAQLALERMILAAGRGRA